MVKKYHHLNRESFGQYIRTVYYQYKTVYYQYTTSTGQYTITVRLLVLLILIVSYSDRLSAQDILTIKKVLDYLYTKVYGEEGPKGADGEPVNCTECFEILCNNKVCIKGVYVEGGGAGEGGG